MSKIEVMTQPDRHENGSSNETTLDKLKELVEQNPVADEDEENKHDEGPEDETKYDYDGFEVPEGKIPIDGHFSTKEIQELVTIAQEEGLLNKEIRVLVKDHNNTIGDKVVISQAEDQEDDKEDDEEVDPKDTDPKDKDPKDKDHEENDEQEKDVHQGTEI